MTNSNEKVKKLNVLDVMADEVTPVTENGYDGVPLFPKNLYRGS